MLLIINIEGRRLYACGLQFIHAIIVNVQLFASLSVGSLDHVIAGQDINLNAAVLLLASGSGVVGHGVFFAITLHANQTACGIAGTYDLVLHRFGTLL